MDNVEDKNNSDLDVIQIVVHMNPNRFAYCKLEKPSVIIICIVIQRLDQSNWQSGWGYVHDIMMDYLFVYLHLNYEKNGHNFQWV